MLIGFLLLLVGFMTGNVKAGVTCGVGETRVISMSSDDNYDAQMTAEPCTSFKTKVIVGRVSRV
jgi:hypothetical protein